MHKENKRDDLTLMELMAPTGTDQSGMVPLIMSADPNWPNDRVMIWQW